MRFARHTEHALLRAGQVSSDTLVVDVTESKKNFRPSELHIDLDNFERNIDAIANLVRPARVAIALKANAYGHGMLRIAKKLDDMNIAMLCVATAEEALELRENGIVAPIMVLSEVPRDAIGPCYFNDITFTVYTVDTINTIAAFATKDHRAHVHLKVDTGMNRVGCEPDEALMLARHISQHENLYFEGIFTHFATAEDTSHPGSSEQLARFEMVLDEIEMAGLTPEIIHAANSAASLRLPSARFSMVRIGLCAYGIYPEPRMTDLIELSLVARLTSRVSFIKDLKAGESVSYGWRYTAERDTRLATLPIGYGDGVPRNLGLSGGTVLLYGIRCPIVGAVTMDQLMVDVGNLSVSVGDEAILLGTQGSETISPTEWADLTGTISYEIVCRLGERLYRSYD